MTRAVLTLVSAALIALGASAWAQAPDPHHSEGVAPGTAQQAPQSPAGMGGMADMMRMMQSMHMMGPGMMGMDMIGRVEGRIAFLRTELKITDAQANAWNSFADALRTNAQKLAAVRSAMMPAGAQQTLTAGLDAQERWLTAQLEGLRAIKAAFTPLYGALSDEQRKTATEILGPHLGLAMMPSSMMPGPMQMGPVGRAPR